MRRKVVHAAGRRAAVTGVVLAAVLLAAGCGEGDEAGGADGGGPDTVSLGPLAVAGPDTPGSPEPAQRLAGTLAIGEECVQLEGDSGPLLLVWHVDRVQWDAESRSVWFRNDDGSTLRLHDGDRVVLRGGPPAGEPDWFAAPAEGCATDRFAVERIRARKRG